MNPVNLKTRLKKLNLKIIGQKDIVKTNKTKGKLNYFLLVIVLIVHQK